MNPNQNPAPGQIGLADIIGLLGHRRWTSIMQKEVHATRVRNHHVTPGIVPALVGALAPSDVWYGVNEITEPPADNKRATENTVARWCAVYADLDVKPGGCPTEDVANAIIDDVSGVYGTRPTYIVASGHGLQPVWVIAHDDAAADLDDDQKRAAAVALLKRHGRMVQAFALARNAKADSVFDLPRVLRAPDTTNHKDPTNPKPTAAVRDAGTPLTVAGIAAALDAADIPEMPSDTMIRGTVVAAPSAWRYRPTGQQRCHYAEDMIDGWATDQPAARHPWLVSQSTRLAAARRHGCLSAADAAGAERELAGRFIALCQRAGDARPVGRAEIDSALRYGTELVATMTDQRVADELGKHQHRDYAAEAIELARMADDLDDLRSQPAPAAPVGCDTAAKPFQPNVTPAPPTPPAADQPAENMPADIPGPPPPAETDGQTVVVPGAVAPTPEQQYIDTVEQIETGYDFWTSRDSLNTIYRAALSSEASPWAVLAITLLRVVAAVPHDVYLPPLGPRGPHGSLNLFAGIAARSGGGKGLAAGVASELYQHASIFDAPPGSGEGIGHLFGAMHTDKETRTTEFKWTRRSVMIDAPEVEALGAIGGRKGSTADAILRQAFSGETLGFSYAAAEKRLRIPRGEYRMTMMVGVQPEAAGALFAGASGGTPQRFLWVPAEDHRLGIETADWDGTPLEGYRPEWWNSGHVISVCPEAMTEIREDRRRRGRRLSVVPNFGDHDETEALDAHAMYAREKVAAALAILDGREFIDAEDWHLSGAVAAMSFLVRDGITQVMEAARLRDAERRGMERGAEQIGAKATETEIDAGRLAATRKRVRDVLADNGEMTHRQMVHRMSKAQRPYLQRALNTLEEDGAVIRVDIETTGRGGRPGASYRLA